MPQRLGRAYLNRAIRFRATSAEDIQTHLGSDDQPRRFFEFGPTGLQDVSYARLAWSTGLLTFSQVRGSLINLAAGVGRELVVGLPTFGTPVLYLNGHRKELPARTAVMLLPGDSVVHVLQDCSMFVLRVPLASSLLFRIESMPFKYRAEKPRFFDLATSEDLLHIMEFLAAEYDRNPEASAEQTEVLGSALVARALIPVRTIFGERRDVDPTHLELCLKAHQALWEDPARRLRIQELAAEVQCSVRQLYRAFEAVGDTTPADFELRSRLNRVRAHLMTMSRPLNTARLARQNGFTNFRSLSAGYRAEFGESPEETILARQRILERVVAGFA